MPEGSGSPLGVAAPPDSAAPGGSAAPPDSTVPRGAVGPTYGVADPDTVAAQYATPDRLRRRMSIWRPGPDGRTPRDVARDLVVGLAPRSVLEVGCGTGELAEEIAAALPACAYLATDASESMVAATAARGLHAEVATIGSLPYPDASFDVVVAAWMLYHVPDLDAALAEVRRVLRPGGSFVAVTNGDRHLARLLEDAGGDILVTQFSSENGEEALRRYFARVAATHIATTAYFTDHTDAVAYLETVDESLAHGLAWFDGPRVEAGYTTVFHAR